MIDLVTAIAVAFAAMAALVSVGEQPPSTVVSLIGSHPTTYEFPAGTCVGCPMAHR